MRSTLHYFTSFLLCSWPCVSDSVIMKDRSRNFWQTQSEKVSRRRHNKGFKWIYDFGREVANNIGLLSISFPHYLTYFEVRLLLDESSLHTFPSYFYTLIRLIFQMNLSNSLSKNSINCWCARMKWKFTISLTYFHKVLINCFNTNYYESIRVRIRLLSDAVPRPMLYALKKNCAVGETTFCSYRISNTSCSRPLSRLKFVQPYKEMFVLDVKGLTNDLEDLAYQR